jgi:hypothetical protein
MKSEMNEKFPIEIIYFDEDSKKVYGDFPISRKYFAQLISIIEEEHPAYVVLKFFYDAETEDDQILATELKKYDNIFTQSSAILKPLQPVSDVEIERYNLPGVNFKGYEYKNLIIPNTVLLNGFNGMGLVDFITKDNNYIDFPIFSNVRGYSIPSLALAIAIDITNEEPLYDSDSIILGKSQINAPDGFFNIDLSEPNKLYPIHSFSEIMSNSESHDFLNKIVIIFIESDQVRTLKSDYPSLHNNAEVVADSINSILKQL